MPVAAQRGEEPDPDLLEYVLVAGRDLDALAPVAAAVDELERAGTVAVVDAVVLVRDGSSTTVEARPAHEHEQLAGLAGARATRGVRLSAHDVQLASVTVDPSESALLLLLEDRWARPLAAVVRANDARLAGGERVARQRVLGALAAGAGTDLVVRGPVVTPLIDQVAQVRQLAHLVERGLLPLDAYDAQRRRVLGA
ncbi:hypothetical protein [Cellulomonas rhizosphaerae]|uniref:hypothetical protein n=1 Tax=Cellulomonas rhizosphaerae TaxID=2293719 RepID=UPI0010FDD237|nr:hypothetical protein [Cellulomonas rhizosphaerae]